MNELVDWFIGLIKSGTKFCKRLYEELQKMADNTCPEPKKPTPTPLRLSDRISARLYCQGNMMIDLGNVDPLNVTIRESEVEVRWAWLVETPFIPEWLVVYDCGEEIARHEMDRDVQAVGTTYPLTILLGRATHG